MEKAMTLDLNGQDLMSILHLPESQVEAAVLVVVGGPQYRVGSHRQFVQLSRYLASQNIPSMRFDYSGMGDSEGDKREFDGVCDDIKVACDALCQQTGTNNVIIWGLCDAASAALIYAHSDSRVNGLILLNPWLRSDASTAKTMFKHYYLQRLMSKDFWLKFLRGKVNVKAAVQDTKGFAGNLSSESSANSGSYQQRMLDGASQFEGKICLILSGNDLTAQEFVEQTNGNKRWSKIMKSRCQIHRIDKADHTFSSSDYKRQVEKISAEFVQRGMS